MKSWIIFLSQLGLVIALAVVAFVVMPTQFYILIGTICTVVTAGLISNASDNLERTGDWWAALVVYSLLFGALWPSLPIVVAWGAVKSRPASSRRAPAAKDSPSPSSPVGTVDHADSSPERRTSAEGQTRS